MSTTYQNADFGDQLVYLMEFLLSQNVLFRLMLLKLFAEMLYPMEHAYVWSPSGSPAVGTC